MSASAPSHLGRYEILDELGKGAMGVVYLARDPIIGRLVALKTFRIGYSTEDAELQEFRARFIREAQSAGILSHPNIVTIHDVVEGGATSVTFIAMEYVRGSNLKQLLQSGEPLDLARIADIVTQVADALDYAHSKGVIHRDVKPANIILQADGRVKITDFGIARLNTSDLTQEGQLLGTPNYMAPERILGKDVDHRTDTFSLGVVLYEMLTRQKPFRGDNLTMVTHRIVYEPFTPPREYSPEVQPAVVAVLERALAKEPSERFDRAGELASAFRQAVEDDAGSGTGAAAVVGAASPDESGDETQEVVVEEHRRSEAPPAPAPESGGPGSAAGARIREDPAGGDVVAVAAAPADRRTEPARSAVPRLVAAAVAGLALAGLLAAGLYALGRGLQPRVGFSSAAQQQRAQAMPWLKAMRRAVDRGDVAVAIAHLDQAMELAPDEARLGPLREDLTARLAAALEEDQGRQLEGLVEEGERLLAAGQVPEAAAAARQVLALAPDHERAATLLSEAEQVAEDQRRRRQEQADLAATEAAAATAAAVLPEEPAPASVVPEPAEATLRVDFFTEISEGILTIYAGDRQILREPFRFVKKKNFFRSEPSAGRIEAARQLPRGEATLRVYVVPQGRNAPEMVEVRQMLRGGETWLLRIHLDGQRKLAATLEPPLMR